MVSAEVRQRWGGVFGLRRAACDAAPPRRRVADERAHPPAVVRGGQLAQCERGEQVVGERGQRVEGLIRDGREAGRVVQVQIRQQLRKKSSRVRL